MAILSKQEIIRHLDRKELISNPRTFVGGAYDLQPSSYDLSIGTIVKKVNSDFPWVDGIRKVSFDPRKKYEDQEEVTLEPGQILFVITMEDLKMPPGICATVYSKNHLSLEGVLAWTTGHVDPGYCGPIIIRLINLKSTNFSVKPGEKIYTIVFSDLRYTDKSQLLCKKGLTRNEALTLVTKSANSALGNTLYDLGLLTNFVKKDEFGRAMLKWLTKTFWGIFTLVITIVVGAIGVWAAILQIIDFYQKPNGVH